jgi:hypothetical protein
VLITSSIRAREAGQPLPDSGDEEDDREVDRAARAAGGGRDGGGGLGIKVSLIHHCAKCRKDGLLKKCG